MRAEWVSVAMMTMSLLPGVVAAATLEKGPLQAGTVEIERFAGVVSIELGSSDEISMKLDAPQEVIDAASISVEGDRLSIRDVRGSGNNTTVVTKEVRAVAGAGGTATVVIGGDGANEEPTELSLTVPAGTGLVIRGFTGTASIPDLEAPLSLEVTSATVTAGRVGSADIAVRGSGTVEVAEVDGDLAMAIQGGGNLAVASGRVGALDISLSGSGTIEFGGAAETAKVRGSGAGRIVIGKVAAPADVDVKGAIGVEIGGS